jgi:hypothetical protein
MSDRNKPHNGRDRSGNFKVKREDVDDLLTEPDGSEIIRDDVRLGGAVEDVGLAGGQRGAYIGELVEENRENVQKATGKEER